MPSSSNIFLEYGVSPKLFQGKVQKLIEKHQIRYLFSHIASIFQALMKYFNGLNHTLKIPPLTTRKKSRQIWYMRLPHLLDALLE